jgi:hypothetical protein
MKRNNRIRTALVAAFFVCVVSGASYAQSPESSCSLTGPSSSIGFYTASLAFDVKPAAGEITSGRARSLVGAVVGLISLVVGGLALARSAGRAGAIMALVLGLLGIILSVVHLSTFTGGFGTGSGRAGAIVALVLSLIGTSLGGISLSRARRVQSSINTS